VNARVGQVATADLTPVERPWRVHNHITTAVGWLSQRRRTAAAAITEQRLAQRATHLAH
jgi:hypothetical protein